MSEDARPKWVSVLVPVEGPEPDLLAVHRETQAQLEALGDPYEFLYLLGVTSPEGEQQALALHHEDPERVRVLRFGHAVGPAAMLRAGIERARGDLLVTVPSRLEVDPEALRSLYTAVRQGADLAFASRNTSDAGGAARRQSRLFNRLISWAAGTQFGDIASGTRVLRRRVVDEIPLYGEFHRYLPVLADRLGFTVKEVPARQRAGARPSALYAPRLYLWRAMDVLTIFFLSRFTRRPLRLFGGVGTLFGGIGGAIVLYLGIERLLGVPLADRPMLVLGTLLLGLGVQAITIGLLGELILFINARNLRDYRVSAVYESEAPGDGSGSA